MFCSNCGAALSSGARFCASCGRPIEGGVVTNQGGDQPTVAPAIDRERTRDDAVTRLPSQRERKPSSSSSGWLSSSDSISHGRFQPGLVLDGRYRIIGLLGKGGMGEVYRADDLRLGQPVALKFLPDVVGADPVRLGQFHTEVRTARQISHPNICRVYDIGEIDGHLFLSMELVDGEDLASSLRRIGRFAEDKAIDIARQLCAGLAAAHERGVLHRDLKPANVMLDGAGKVRLMDFGLAAVGAVEDVRAGTPAYMAPEQLLGREVTARSDIYSLGLVLYELFTGRRAFTAATLNELVEEHQTGQLTPPSTLVSALDPAIERAILRCLDRDPVRRPTSALAVAAGLPGGDPLAAALAAGETPSPEMVAAAGEGTGLSRAVAVPVFIAVIAGIVAAYAMALRNNPLELMRPELTADVLAQKARDAVRQLGYQDRPRDEAYGFRLDEAQMDHFREAQEAPRWTEELSKRPAPLSFWYRQSQSPLLGVQFHHDLLTPGIVSPDDPAPIESGMIQLTLDHQGFLTYFEAIPPQFQESHPQTLPVDWTTLFTLAGLDQSTLQVGEPQWNFLAASDSRMAWMGTWPGSTRPLRVEAAALYGRPVAFQAIGPWTEPWRTSESTTGTETVVIVAIFLLVLGVLAGGSLLARRNLREGRGDRRGAQALGSAVAVALWMLWICQVHVAPSVLMMAILLLTVVTTVFYAALFWALYLALEPLVRRSWPQTLVSWTTLLSGRVRDPIVGRDVLFGVALGVAIALLLRSAELISGNPIWPDTALLGGARSTAGVILSHTLYAMRTALFFFFLLFLLRVMLRNQWLAALVFVLMFSVLNALPSSRPVIDGVSTFLYFAMSAVVVLRWGLTALAVGVLAADMLLIVSATTDPGAWFVGGTILVMAIPLALAGWAFYTSMGGRLLKGGLL